MEYKSIREMADEWGISKRRIQVLCSENRIEGAVRIGSVKAEDNGGRTKPKDCTFDKVFEAVLIKAHEMGGNYVVLTKHTEPNKKKLEPCHALEAEVYILE